MGPKAPKPNGAEGPIMPSAGARDRGAKRPRSLVYIYIYIYIYILSENPPFGWDFLLAPLEGINGAFGPIRFWGLRPQNLCVLFTRKNKKVGRRVYHQSNIKVNYVIFSMVTF